MDVISMRKSLSLEEKAALCSGEGSWSSKAFPKRKIPAITMTDGPCGVRRQPEGGGEAAPATCFPAPCLTACSFDTKLLYEIGRAMGQECRALGVSLLLAPGINLKRSPLGGRNFEYFSEDPLLSGTLAAAFIRGVQSTGVGAAVKHFAMNHQENWRLVSNSVAEEADMRNWYLKSFEIAVRKGKPAAVMAAYNRVNGIYASEHRGLLTQLLREEWGFEGMVISDWGAVNDRVAALLAGMDFEMPGSAAVNDPRIVQAVREGRLPENVLDRSVERILRLVDQTSEALSAEPASLDVAAGHAVARKAAAQSVVLLENDGLLPMSGTPAVIGYPAEEPHLQGGGSSHVNPTKKESFLSVCAEKGISVAYEPGASENGDEEADLKLKERAVRLAESSESVLLFLGLTAADESEGFDRKTMCLPRNQVRLAEEVLAANPNTAVIVMAGGVVDLAFAQNASAILYAYLAGQGGMSALYDLIFGRISPCGKLAESFPLRIEDTPCYPWFGQRESYYGEKTGVGYRCYDQRNNFKEVRWPFGHGLTYSDFSISQVSVQEEEPGIRVSGVLENIGDMRAAEVVQIYLTVPGEDVHALAGFWKKELNPGEKAEFAVLIGTEQLARYREEAKGYERREGSYTVEVGFSSRDIRWRDALFSSVRTCEPVEACLGNAAGEEASQPGRFHPNSTVEDLLGTPVGDLLYQRLLDELAKQKEKGECDENFYHMYLAQVRQYPLRTFVLATQGAFSFSMLDRLLKLLSCPEPDMEEARRLLSVIRVI